MPRFVARGVKGTPHDVAAVRMCVDSSFSHNSVIRVTAGELGVRYVQ